MRERSIEETIRDCAGHYTFDPSYFHENEQYMEMQWQNTIWPHIQDADFSRVLEIACGYGRNSAKLAAVATEIILTDVNQECLDACRKRFANHTGDCRFQYVQTDGKSLPQVADASVSFVYSWDSMVHFDPRVMEAYVGEFARVMRPGASAFIHHSNYGTVKPNSWWRDNPAWRSGFSAAMMAELCQKNGLLVEKQTLLRWSHVDDLDCVTVFRKLT